MNNTHPEHPGSWSSPELRITGPAHRKIREGSIVQVKAEMSEPNDSPHNLKRGVVGKVTGPMGKAWVTMQVIQGNDTYSKGETLTLRRNQVIIGSLVEEAITKAELEIEATDLIEDW